METLYSDALLGRGTSIGRWAGVGPYYAMFPVRFAFDVISQYTLPGQAVLDPFAGRASSVYAGAALMRRALGIEINPVGWLYGHVKLWPASRDRVTKRLEEIGVLAKEFETDALSELPEFYHWCYSQSVLQYLVTARQVLQWRTRKTDATLMALILIDLHGKRPNSLSNQMRQSKAMSPDYSVGWWRTHNMLPPDVDPVVFLKRKVDWRYKQGCHCLRNGRVLLGDSSKILNTLRTGNLKDICPRFDLLFTSPPYYGITNYFYDQWLRRWMLGGPSLPLATGGKWERKFESHQEYRELLESVFRASSAIMTDNAVVYVRTDAREFTYQTTVEVLRGVFPGKTMKAIRRPFAKQTQTALYGDKSEKPGEVDIILS